MFCEKRPILFKKSLWFHVSVNQCCRSAPVRAIYTSGGPRTVAARWLTYHPGPSRGPRGRGKAADRHPWTPYGSRYIYWLKSAKEIARCPAVYRTVPRRVPYATRRVFHGLFTGYRFEENAGRIGSSVFGTPAPVRVVKIVPAPVKSEGSRSGAVRKWPIYPFLLAVRGPGVICESPLSLRWQIMPL